MFVRRCAPRASHGAMAAGLLVWKTSLALPCRSCGGCRGGMDALLGSRIATPGFLPGAIRCPSCLGAGRVPARWSEMCIRDRFTVHEAAIDSVVSLKRKQAEGQFDLFSDAEDGGAEAMGDASVTVPDLEEWDKKTKLNFEREMLGLYVSDHPLSGMQSILASLREIDVYKRQIQSLKQFETKYRARLTEYLGQLASQVSESNNYVDQTSSKTN